jgi:hypothetical protein
VSAGADVPSVPPDVPGWERLERAAGEALSALDDWRARALAAEAETGRLRGAVSAAAAGVSEGAAGEELRRLREENAALHARLEVARERVRSIVARIAALEAGR